MNKITFLTFIFTIVKTKCIVVNTLDNKLFGIIDEKTYLLILVEQPTNKITNASSNGFKPKADNPWRKFKIR